MKTVYSYGLLLLQAVCIVVFAGSLRWAVIDATPIVIIIMGIAAAFLALFVYVRDGILLSDGREEGKAMAPPREARPAPRRLALPEEFIATVERLQGHIEETQASAAAAVAVGKIAAEIMYGVDRHVAQVKDENVALRDDGARMDASLNAIALVVQERTGAPVPTAPLRRHFDGRGSEPVLTEPRVVMKPKGPEHYAPPHLRAVLDAAATEPTPAFLRPQIDLSELERAVQDRNGSDL